MAFHSLPFLLPLLGTLDIRFIYIVISWLPELSLQGGLTANTPHFIILLIIPCLASKGLSTVCENDQLINFLTYFGRK